MNAPEPQRLFGYWIAAVFLATATGTLTGQEDQERRQTSTLDRIQNSAPSFLVRAEVDRKSRSYRQHDTLTVRAVSEVDGYLYALYR